MGLTQYAATKIEDGGATVVYMLTTDMLIRGDPDLALFAQEFIDDEDEFLRTFGEAWTTVMNADRFDGPAGNLCASDDNQKKKETKKEKEDKKTINSLIASTAVLGGLLLIALIVLV